MLYKLLIDNINSLPLEIVIEEDEADDPIDEGFGDETHGTGEMFPVAVKKP